ncbi:28701_t:CDS:2 [Gigaspora margarita]|uniref:28701_t:CDS:1 n=1 Tax=Gigaspora margarita TaxID=4874 RepID=A0ABN7VND4_GIGMA|nr:28701_t:CDS:2 [Gigaspora margarita]
MPFPDTKIIVYENEKPKIIYANSFILKICSEYFQSEYFEIHKPNATPDSMNIIMRFLYGTDFTTPSNNTRIRTLLNTFSLADKMRIMELRDVLKLYFTENIITIMEDLEYIEMIILHDDIKEILLKKLCLKPALLFKFENLQISKNLFYELISMSELRLEEHKLLNRIIQYWSDTNGFPEKKYLIKCIRFNQITIGEINDIIRKFKQKKINTVILDELLIQYNANKNSYYDLRDGNFCLESELLDLDTAKILITWISSEKNYHEYWYKFELLFNSERDGGYNPLDWECKNEKAIGCSTSNGPMFGTADLYVGRLPAEILRSFKGYQTKEFTRKTEPPKMRNTTHAKPTSVLFLEVEGSSDYREKKMLLLIIEDPVPQIKQPQGSYHAAVTNTSEDYVNSVDKSGIKIYGQATFYLALCHIHGHGVEQDKQFALKIAKHLYEKNKYEDAWNIYRELTNDEDDKTKLEALIKMAN